MIRIFLMSFRRGTLQWSFQWRNTLRDLRATRFLRTGPACSFRFSILRRPRVPFSQIDSDYSENSEVDGDQPVAQKGAQNLEQGNSNSPPFKNAASQCPKRRPGMRRTGPVVSVLVKTFDVSPFLRDLRQPRNSLRRFARKPVFANPRIGIRPEW